jgi:hypothetical protein
LAEEERKSEAGTSAKEWGGVDGLVSRGSIEGDGDIY